jgi:hypothetical protein
MDFYRSFTDEENHEKININSIESDLNFIEKCIFGVLRDTLKEFKLSTVLRVVGGIFFFFQLLFFKVG